MVASYPPSKETPWEGVCTQHKSCEYGDMNDWDDRGHASNDC